MSDANYDYYLTNFENIYSQYANKFVVVKNNSIIGAYETFEEAYDETVKTEKIGTFLIQHCVQSEDNANFFYSNNVIFA